MRCVQSCLSRTAASALARNSVNGVAKAVARAARHTSVCKQKKKGESRMEKKDEKLRESQARIRNLACDGCRLGF